MIHYFAGNLGHAFVILAFVSAIVATFAFAKNINDPEKRWSTYAKGAYYLHAFSVIGIVITLFWMISNHMFEYHYVYNYTSKILPVYYQISSFWNGQEGSFLLWMFWNAILGLILIHTNKEWRAPLMAVFTFTQLFLVSMIMGVVIFDIKIGSSPFILLRDVIQDKIFEIQPDFIPEDGKGLNPLLQNYWMVIHPPTLFLGFAMTVIPFAYAIAGLITGKFKEWIRPALPWAEFAAAVLGLGILMGAYWAYETLNFGGYWNWDPVENAIYVPWLILVAAIHTMIAFRKSPSALKASIILVLVTYILIVYSTFLTRSGVLGNASVHSFTDLGLSGQLLIYLFVFVGLSAFLIARVWNKMPKNADETSAYSREFWIFMGATALCFMGFHVIFATSFPVFNEIAELFGGDLNLAPPDVASYSQVQLYFAVLVALLSGTGQFFWWNKMDKAKLKQELSAPVMISLILSALIFVIGKVQDIWYMVLLTAGVYTVVANIKMFVSISKSNIKLSGGAVTHVGMGLMLIGILFSSGYSNILSKNNTGLLWSKEFPDEVNQNNLLLFLNEPRQMGEHTLLYKGMRKLTIDDGYVDINDIEAVVSPLEAVMAKASVTSTGVQLKAGDTIRMINDENSYFEVEYQRLNGDKFTLYPRVQMNETMDMIVYSPDIERTLTADLYTHVRTFPDPAQETEWGEIEEITVKPGDQFFLNDYVARFIEMKPIRNVEGILLGPEDVAVQATIEIEGENKTYVAQPIYIIKDKMAGRIPDFVNDLASRITIQSILPEENSFVFGLSTTQKDWIIIEAVEKPWINVLWFGTLLLTIGFGMATYRRYSDFTKMRDKGME